ncbi:MAG: hypothetical protein OEV42_04330 [Deltaproteobacteria bacterium]|nr:hypothetical protein [Deltaproteobacteria bacterium]
MTEEEYNKAMAKGIALLKKGHAVDAVFIFEEIIEKTGPNGAAYSLLGLSMARAKVEIKKAEKYCIEAIKMHPSRADYYRNLAELYMIARKRNKAIMVLERGVKVCKNKKMLLQKWRMMGMRKSPPLPFLSRSNPVNKYLGLLRRRISS